MSFGYSEDEVPHLFPEKPAVGHYFTGTNEFIRGVFRSKGRLLDAMFIEI